MTKWYITILKSNMVEEASLEFQLKKNNETITSRSNKR